MTGTLTPKRLLLLAEPRAKLDYYEILRRASQPCWFIRVGMQGPALSPISISPRAAWSSALAALHASFPRTPDGRSENATQEGHQA